MVPPQPASPTCYRPQLVLDDLSSTGEGLAAGGPRSRELESCEQRLALSASLAADWLLELASLGGDAPIDHNDSINQNDLFSQADQLRQNLHAELDVESEATQQLIDWNGQGWNGRGQTVAVIDSGVAWDHVSLGAGFGPGYRVVGGWDFAENDDNPYDDGPSGYHGTHVASLVGGLSESFVGIAPESDIVALRVFDDSGRGELQWVESALQWVIEHQNDYDSPITTVNLSLGVTLDETNRDTAMNLLEDELATLRDSGILVFAAAGNQFNQDNGQFNQGDGPGLGLSYPASSPSVVPVSSIDDGGGLSDFAQRNDGILTAPGEAVRGGVPEHVFGWDGVMDDVALLSGTSMATPQVAAISMLVRQTFSIEGLQPTTDQILERLDALTQEQFSESDGITYRTFDLSRLLDFLPSSLTEETSTEPAENFVVTDRLDGSNDNEFVVLDLRGGIGNATLRIGDQTYSIDQTVTDAAIVIDVRGGSDTLQILGSETAERLVLHADSETPSTLAALGMEFELRGFEQVEFVGGGGPDRASLFDGAGDDTLTSYPSKAKLSGVGYQFDISDVNRIYVHATGGGNDQAFIYDSELDDQLAIRPQFTSLRNDETFQLAYGFEKVFAYSFLAGDDSIEIRDSSGDDTLSVSASRSIIVGPGYQVTATGFASTTATSTAGGNDVARIYADTTDARWDVHSDRTQWTGEDGTERIARGFELVETFESGDRVHGGQPPVEIEPQSQAVLQLEEDETEDPWWLLPSNPLAPLSERDASRKVFEDFGSPS